MAQVAAQAQVADTVRQLLCSMSTVSASKPLVAVEKCVEQCERAASGAAAACGAMQAAFDAKASSFKHHGRAKGTCDGDDLAPEPEEWLPQPLSCVRILSDSDNSNAPR